MIKELTDSIDKYLKRFRNEFDDLRKKIIPMQMASSSYTSMNSIIQEVSRRAENSKEFEDVQIVATNIVGRELISQVFVDALKHYFRRSGAYLEAVNEREVRVEYYADKLVQALSQKSTTRVLHLISLPWANIEARGSNIDAGWFRLRQYKVKELEKLFESEIRGVFYPECVITEPELKLLSEQWWLEVEDAEEPCPVGSISLDFRPIFGTLSLTDLTPKVEQALATIILLDWERETEERKIWWSGLPLGHRIALGESLFKPPPHMIAGEYFEISDNEPEIIVPRYRCCNVHQLPNLAHQVESIGKLIEADFLLKIVFRYILRAALVNGYGYRRIDQLINHIIAMDALVGSGDSGRGAISRRIGVLVGNTERRDDIESQVKELYDIRSALVHGGKKEKIGPCLSWKAHELLVKATRRTIDFFSIETTGYEITRDEFLAFLDLLARTREVSKIEELAKRWEMVTRQWNL